MRLISLHLKNIRSYAEAELEFKEGVTLLSGDIGSGKSTILLAIEFALFGISRGEITGMALLRHGMGEGIVTICFEVQGKTYTVQRALKRTKNGIVQDSGWLEENGSRTTLTATELRAKVFEILGYPLQFLSKQKNLLYRFTIYTPQEEMKSVLSQTIEERLETIRRIFGVDTYKTIRDNAQVLAKELKEKAARQEEVLLRISEQKKRLEDRLAAGEGLQDERKSLIEQRAQIAKKKEDAELLQKSRERDFAKVEQELQMLMMKLRQRQQAKEDIVRLEQRKKQQGGRLDHTRISLEGIEKKLGEAIGLPGPDEIDSELVQLQEELESLRQQEGKIHAIREQCSHSPDIGAGERCPSCMQEVAGEHLARVREELRARSAAAEKKQATIATRLEETKQKIARLRDIQRKIGEAAQWEERKKDLRIKIEEYGEEMQEIEDAIDRCNKRLKDMPDLASDDLEKRRARLKTEVAEASRLVGNLQEQELRVEKRFAALEQELQHIQELQEELLGIRQDEERRKKIRANATAVRNWMVEKFTPFTTTIEQHVLAAVHGSFDSAFRQWFARLVEDDGLAARLDTEFSPIIEQNGYETDVSCLSGGERTAVSLAYRLALVHTIHVLLSHLGTAGLVMLDEPTDGFSSEQLGRMRDVLQELQMEQIILVSHEEQLEAFVDHIIRVQKTGAGSRVVA